MKTTVLNTGKKDEIIENNVATKYVLSACAFLSVLILGRAIHDIFFYAIAIASFGIICASTIQNCIPILFFLLPFSSILKYTPDGISVFTVLFFVVIAKMMLARKKVDSRILLCVMALLAYLILFSGLSRWAAIVTMCAGILFLYYLRMDEFSATHTVSAFSVGIILSSLLGMLKSYLPIVHAFVRDNRLQVGDGEYTYRFSGLQGNANYYTMDIVIALAAIIVLMYMGNSRKTLTACFIVLSVFGFMSVSKSFLITWILLVICWLFVSAKSGKGGIKGFVFVGVICLAAIYFFAYDYVNLYIFRFTSDGSESLSDMTTGRLDIWAEYIREILSDLKILFFGNGINTLGSIEKGIHNTYIEFIFYLGITGTALVLWGIKLGVGRIITKKIMWIPVLTLLIRMTAIGIVTYDNLWFYLGVLTLLAKYVAKKDVAAIPTGD